MVCVERMIDDMEYEKQIKLLENGKQIGYCSIENEKILIQCGIQKKDQLYFVYFFEGDISEDPFGDHGKCNEEFYSFKILASAIEYIKTRKFEFNEFKPQKGNKIFQVAHHDYIAL